MATTRTPSGGTRGAAAGPPAAPPGSPGALLAAGDALTASAPHVRDTLSVRAVARAFALALLPCLLAGLHNTGQQALRAAAALDAGPTLDGLGERTFAVGRDPSQLLDCQWQGLLLLGPALVAGLLAGGACQLLFAWLRRRPLSCGLASTVLIVTLGLPPTVPAWQVAVAVAFAVVMAQEVFGGTGMNVVHPALVALGYVTLAHPASVRGEAVWALVAGPPGAPPLVLAGQGGAEALTAAGLDGWDLLAGWLPGVPAATSVAACLLGAAWLLSRRLICWRVLAGGVLGVLAAAGLAGVWSAAPLASLPASWHLVAGAFVFGLVFVATDPATSASTPAGRWVFGVLVGGLTVLLRVATPGSGEAVFPAILLANVAAPLVDHVVVALAIRRRRRRHV